MNRWGEAHWFVIIPDEPSIIMSRTDRGVGKPSWPPQQRRFHGEGGVLEEVGSGLGAVIFVAREEGGDGMLGGEDGEGSIDKTIDFTERGIGDDGVEIKGWLVAFEKVELSVGWRLRS